MRDEDNRGGSNRISSEGLSKPLSYGETQAIAQQHRNRQDDAMRPGDHEARTLRAITVDAKMKAPRFYK